MTQLDLLPPLSPAFHHDRVSFNTLLPPKNPFLLSGFVRALGALLNGNIRERRNNYQLGKTNNCQQRHTCISLLRPVFCQDNFYQPLAFDWRNLNPTGN